MLRLATGLLKVSLRTSKVLMRAAAPRMMMCQAKPPTNKGVDAVSKLAVQLDEEIKYEKENKPDSAEILKILEKNGWSVKQEGTFVELKKQSGDKSIYLSFNVRSPQAAKQEEEGDAKKEGEEEEEMPDYFEFNVYVKRPGVDKVIYADYLSADGQCSITNLGFTKDYEAHRRTSRLERQSNHYQGPDLDSMDETLLENLEQYFESLGINEETIAAIEDFSIDSEHPHYVAWLEDLRTFIR